MKLTLLKRTEILTSSKWRAVLFGGCFALAMILSENAFSQSSLPSLGDRISGTVSLDQEYAMGQRFLSQIRRSATTISDPLLTGYLESVTYKLASRSQLTDHRLSFVIIDSQALNAFITSGK